MGGACSTCRREEECIQGKTEGNRSLGRPRHRWKDNIKMNLQEFEGGACTGLTWIRLETDGGHI